jgi:NADH-quinone oxidoreductase subunit G
MPKVTIDGKEFEAKQGQTVIQVALENGIEIPHFCWHPALTVAGNCRMCLVDIEKTPKLSIACSTTVSDGMIVHTQNEKSLRGREDVMEFLLINHPLDCPICDEAGQCKLQDYAFSHSRGVSRFEEEKVHKDKRIPFGPNVLFDAERCISCSRFKARPWDMSFTETICPHCARGCNIRAGVRNNEILRLEPRPNPNVNDFWMCDMGRLESYPPVNSETRLAGAWARKSGTLEHIALEDAVKAIVNVLKIYRADEIVFIASPFATVEDNFALSEIAKHTSKNIGYFPHFIGEDAKLLIRADRTPNSYGLKLLGIPEFGKDFSESLKAGKIKAIYALEDDFLSRNNLIFDKVEFFACHATNSSSTTDRADVILPASSWAEKEGVIVNFEGWAQRLKPAVESSHHVRNLEHMNRSRLDRFGSKFDRWAVGRKVDAYESWRLAEMVGAGIGIKTDHLYTEDVFETAAASVPGLKGLSHDKIGTLGHPVAGIDKEVKKSFYREVFQLNTLDHVEIMGPEIEIEI